MVENLPERRAEIEPRPQTGSIEVITGCMFSGKTDELIRRVRRAKYARKGVQVFKPLIDKRRGENSINTFDGAKIPATPVENSLEIIERVEPKTNWVAVDEAQFFDMDLPEVCDRLAKKGIRVMIAGLQADFRGEPFGPMDMLMRDAEKIHRLNAHCSICGGVASRTQRVIIEKDEEDVDVRRPANYDDPQTVVGGEDLYEARCREHHEVPGKPDKG